MTKPVTGKKLCETLTCYSPVDFRYVQLDSEVHIPCKSGQNNGTQPQAPGSHTQPFGVVLSLDLEVSEQDGSLLAAAAHRPDSGNSLSMSERPKNSSLERFDRLAENALFLLGDNISQHGIPQLRAHNPTSGS